MPDKETPKNPNQNFFARDIDPDVESHVEEIMESTPQAASTKTETPTTVGTDTGAPLLPSDKLPEAVINPKTPESSQPSAPQQPQSPTPSFDSQPEDVKPNIDVDDPETERAVDDIVSKDADRMLAIEDAKAELVSEGSATLSLGPMAKFKIWLADLFSSPATKWIMALLIFGAIAAVAAIPTSRYFVLNTLGVRASTSMIILDSNSGQPIKNAEVIVGSQTATTDIEGYAKVDKIKLGTQELIVKKPAYADTTTQKTFGWGSNQLGEVRMTAVGSQYSFQVVDLLSDNPIAKAEAVSGEASAVANDKGEISLVVEDTGKDSVVVEIKAEGYRTEKLTMPVGKQEMKKIMLVPARKHAFVSKREGTFDLYKTDIDGKNEEVVLTGTGNEREEGMVLISHPTKNTVAFVSSRGQSRSAQGELFSNLNIVNLDNNESTEVVESERIQVIDFIDDKLIYVKVNQDAKEDAPDRHKLMSYDIETKEDKELAKASYFNDVVVAQGNVYFSPAAYQKNSEVGFIKIKPDGSAKENIFKKEIFNIYRTAYDKLTLAVGTDWYEFDLVTSQLNKLDGAPSNRQSRVYATNNETGQSVWVDQRDGKGVLLLFDDQSNEDKPLQSVGGLGNPIRWLDNTHVVYRVKTNTEVADYVISTDGGEAKKIADVTDTVGLDRWYYY